MRLSVTGGLLLPVVIALSSAPLASSLSEEVVVTANRVAHPLSTIPNTITVIDQQALQQQLSVNRDISTVLGNLIPGFSPSRQKMTNAGESLRGRKPLYMIDGVPQSNPLRNGGRDGHTIDPAMIERIEVLHGANAIHGLGASGGIINLITRQPADDLTQSIRIESAFQTEDVAESADYGLTYSLSNRVGNADVLASLSYRSSGMAYDARGDIIGADNTQGDSMDSQTLNGFIKTGYNWDEQRLELTVNRYDIEGNNDWVSVPGDVSADIPSSAIKGDINGKGARNKVTTMSLTYSHQDIVGHSLNVQVFSQDFAATYGAQATPIATFQDPAYGVDVQDQSQNNSEKLGLKLTLAKDTLAGLPLNLVYGLDLLEDETWQALVLTGRTWVPETRYESYAPFAQLEYTGIDRLTVTSGVRYEKSKLEVDDFTTLASYGSRFVEGGKPDFSETLYNLGGTYQLTDAWRVFANYSEAFSMPDVGRVLRGINVAGQSVESFLDLQPILTENSELGVEFDNGTVSAQLSYYTSDSDFGQRLQRGSDGIYSVKREQTEVEGIELRSAWHVSQVDVLGLRYAHTEGRYDSNADGSVDTDLGGSNISPDRVNLSWERDWTGKLSSRLQINHLLDRDFDNSTGVTTNQFKGYTTVDLSMQAGLMGGTATVAVQNLSNEDYYTYYSQVNPNDLRNFKGMGRSLSLAWQMQF